MINCCIYCLSSNFVLNGHDARGVQRYKCCECKRRFCEKGIFARMRTPKEIIMNALYLRSYLLSLHDVKNIWIDFFAMHYNYLMPHGEKEQVKVEWEQIPMIIQSG